MSIIPENVRAARKRKGMSQQQLADAAGVGQSTIDKLETGKTRASRYIARIAAVLDVDVSELDSDFEAGAILPVRVESYAVPGRKILGDKDFPIYAAYEGEGGSMVLSSEPLEYIHRPEFMLNETEGYGIMVVGEAMEPAYEPGDTALVHPRLPILPATDVILYAQAEGSGERAIIRRLLKTTQEAWLLRQWNPPQGEVQDFALDRNGWTKCHRVVGKYSRR